MRLERLLHRLRQKKGADEERKKEEEKKRKRKREAHAVQSLGPFARGPVRRVARARLDLP